MQDPQVENEKQVRYGSIKPHLTCPLEQTNYSPYFFFLRMIEVWLVPSIWAA